jgi:hypothetical protein
VYSVGGIATGIEKNVLMEIEVMNTESSEVVDIGFAILSFVAEGKSYTIKKELVMKVSQDGNLGEICKKLEENLLRVKAGEVLQQAQDDIKKGDFEMAKNKMRAFKC